MSERYGYEKAKTMDGVAYVGPLEYVVDREFKDGHPPRRFSAPEAATEMNRLYAEVERLRADAARRFVLTEDDDGHWYVIPADKQREASAYFEAVSKFWDEPPSDENATEPERPDWLEEVGGAPSLVTFTDPQIGVGF